MSMWINAFAIDPRIFRFSECRVVQAMRGGELKFLAQLNHGKLPVGNGHPKKRRQKEPSALQGQGWPQSAQAIEYINHRLFRGLLCQTPRGAIDDRDRMLANSRVDL